MGVRNKNRNRSSPATGLASMTRCIHMKSAAQKVVRSRIGMFCTGLTTRLSQPRVRNAGLKVSPFGCRLDFPVTTRATGKSSGNSKRRRNSGSTRDTRIDPGDPESGIRKRALRCARAVTRRSFSCARSSAALGLTELARRRARATLSDCAECAGGPREEDDPQEENVHREGSSPPRRAACVRHGEESAGSARPRHRGAEASAQSRA